MAQGRTSNLRALFPGWFTASKEQEPFFREAIVALDTNVLLSFYRITPHARQQLSSVLNAVNERLWIPHQAALEFVRNRPKVIADRNSRFSNVQRALQTAMEKATGELHSAVDSLSKLRASVVAHTAWTPDDHNLTQAEIKKRLLEMMEPAFAELRRLKAEQDIEHGDVQSGSRDSILREIESITEGRIGPEYDVAQIRKIVDEATGFRFPNGVPPGYLDAKDKPPLRAAGDLILWLQIVDRARSLRQEPRRILLVTADVKEDWWQLDTDGKPSAARAELVQELRDKAETDLLLLTLADFLEGSRSYLARDVSKETVEEAREVITKEQQEAEEALSYLVPERHGLREMSEADLEAFVRDAFVAMGFTVKAGRASAFGDLIVESDHVRCVIEVKKGPYVSPKAVHALEAAMRLTNSSRGILVSTGAFPSSTIAAAKRSGSIQLLDVDDLEALLTHFHRSDIVEEDR